MFVFCFRTLAVNSVSDFSQRGLCCTFLFFFVFVQYISHLLEIQIALLARSGLSARFTGVALSTGRLGLAWGILTTSCHSVL